ncbi:MAG TPA: gamma-glutamyltransferase [Thermoanaerobaculia bacterium]
MLFCILHFAFCISPLTAGGQISAKKAALSTVSPLATQVGLAVLQRGGNAIDAAVAVSFALAVAHPQAGNLGGGGFLVYWDSETKAIWTLDYREVAPLAAKRDMYVQPDGSVSSASRTGALAVGVPGSVAGLAAMHEKFGTQEWKELVAPSISLAKDGFRVDETLASDLAKQKSERAIDKFASTAAIFYPEGKPLAAGSTFVQKELAATLERIAANGPKDFYDGETSRRLVDAVRQAGGILGHRDLREYKPTWRAPIKIRFGDYELCTMAAPSAGGLVMGEALNILSAYNLAANGFQSPKSLHLFVEAVRRAYIDRNKYLGDPSATRIPYRELLSAERANQWRASLDPERSTPTITLTEPAATPAESSETTHFSIVDAMGNVASVTTTLNENFGSGFVAPGLGFFLNNEMDDFTPAPGKPNRYGLVQGNANAIEPGRKMASSMSPTIVLRKGVPYLALGTRGGPTIPTSILQVFLNVAVYKMTLADAVAAPRYHHQAVPDTIYYERGRGTPATVDAINLMGHGIIPREAIGDVHAILIEKDRITAVADPRAGGAPGGY